MTNARSLQMSEAIETRNTRHPLLSRRSPIRYIFGVVPMYLGIPVLLPILCVPTTDNYLQPKNYLDLAPYWPIGAAAAAAGVFLWLWSPFLLFTRGKGMPIEDKDGPVFDGGTKHLVCTGPYRHTRNPMYTGYLT